jgi:hypothetical protein
LRQVFELYLPDERPDNECWLWTGPQDHGYGRMNYPGHRTHAHRIAYELAHNVDLPRSVSVRACDLNPLCVNPAHLDIDDYSQRRYPGRKGIQTRTKLTAREVKEIRRLADTGHRYGKLAKDFEVSPQTIKSIVRRESWADLR